MINLKPLKKGLRAQSALPVGLPLLLGLALLLSSCAQLSQNAQSHSSAVATPKPVEFVYKNPKAKKVCVVGDFNKWSTKVHCMNRSGDTWKLNMTLPPGRYEYKFIVNGRNWQEDPNATMSGKSGFGEQAENSVLIVE
jgi:1,4-alpha-glucan branching enzyme